MTTRKDYLDGKISHQRYYEQLAQEAGVSFRNSPFLVQVQKALEQGDELLNSIPLTRWDAYAYGARRATEPVFKAHGDFWTLAGGVCLAKAAARKAAMEAK